jgi:hypothetical protein
VFNLIMRWFDWNEAQGSLPLGRMFEYTEAPLVEQFTANGQPAFDRLVRLPCLFMNEGTGAEVCRVGTVTRTRMVNREVMFDYVLDGDVPPLENSLIYANRLALDMPQDFEFSRNHWAVKDVDLYRMLLRTVRPRRQRPTVFRIEEHERIEPELVSVMMPFDAGFNAVYESIGASAANAGLRARRADDIWENPAIIQDVVSLIDRSRVVICDCTGRNPNVFYEAGIAHTLGREVILITQADHDIPFDLRHLRYVRYLNNGEGRAALAAALQGRLETILGH